MDNIPTKNPGDQYTSAEFNQSNEEEKNLVQDTGITLSGADAKQFGKAIAQYASSGNFYADTGAADAYVLSGIGTKQTPEILQDGTETRFIAANSNTGASTVALTTFGAKAIKKYGGANDLEANDIIIGQEVTLTYILSSDEFEINSIDSPIVSESIPLFLPRAGLTLSNNSIAPTTDLDIAPGTFKNKTSSDAFTLATILVKELDNVWAAGTNAGGRASAVAYSINTWYHSFAIAKADGTVDVGFDTDINAVNLLADATGYTFFRRIGSIKTDGASSILLFTQFDDLFVWTAPIQQAVAITTTPTDFVIEAPIDVFTHVGAFFDINVISGGSEAIDLRSTFQTTGVEVCQGNFAIAPHQGNDGRGFGQVIADQSSEINLGVAFGGQNYFVTVTQWREINF